MGEGPRLDEELQRRLIAARNYVGYSQTVLGEMLGGVSKKTVVEYETGEPDLRPFQVRNLVSGYADITGIPEDWFTADWSQLDLAYQPPTDEIAALRERLDQIEGDFRDLLGMIREGFDGLNARLNDTAGKAGDGVTTTRGNP